MCGSKLVIVALVIVAFGVGLLTHDVFFPDYHIKTKEIVLDDHGMKYSQSIWKGDMEDLSNTGYILDSERNCYKIPSYCLVFNPFDEHYRDGDVFRITYEEYDPPKGYKFCSKVKGIFKLNDYGYYDPKGYTFETNKKITELKRIR